MEELKRKDAREPRYRATKGGAGRGSRSVMEEYWPWSQGVVVQSSALSFSDDITSGTASVA